RQGQGVHQSPRPDRLRKLLDLQPVTAGDVVRRGVDQIHVDQFDLRGHGDDGGRVGLCHWSGLLELSVMPGEFQPGDPGEAAVTLPRADAGCQVAIESPIFDLVVVFVSPADWAVADFDLSSTTVMLSDSAHRADPVGVGRKKGSLSGIAAQAVFTEVNRANSDHNTISTGGLATLLVLLLRCFG